MDKDIAAIATKDVHLVPDEIADDNADEHAVQDASMYCCLEECLIFIQTQMPLKPSYHGTCFIQTQMPLKPSYHGTCSVITTGYEIRIRKHLTHQAGKFKKLPAQTENNQHRPQKSKATEYE